MFAVTHHKEEMASGCNKQGFVGINPSADKSDGNIFGLLVMKILKLPFLLIHTPCAKGHHECLAVTMHNTFEEQDSNH